MKPVDLLLNLVLNNHIDCYCHQDYCQQLIYKHVVAIAAVVAVDVVVDGVIVVAAAVVVVKLMYKDYYKYYVYRY